MKSKTYKYGKYHFKTYIKTVGHGFEVGFYLDSKLTFVGNFIYKNEGIIWFNQINRELRDFTKKYWVSDKAPSQWYKTFFKNHLYQSYYLYLDKSFNKYQKNYTLAFNRDLKKWHQLKRNWNHFEKIPTLKVA